MLAEANPNEFWHLNRLVEVRGVRKGFTEHMLFELGLEKWVKSYQIERIRKDEGILDTIIAVGKVQDMKKHALFRK